MKILLIDLYAGSERMGMEFRPYYMAREWMRRGHEVTLVAADYTHLRKQNPTVGRNFEEQEHEGVRYVFLKTPSYNGNNASRGKNILAFVCKLWRGAGYMAKRYRPDAVIASSTCPLDIWPAAAIARRARAALFFEIHDLWPLTPMEMGRLSKWNPVIFTMQRAEDYAFRHARRIISILPNTGEYVAARGFDAKKIVYVPNGVFADDGPKGAPAESETVRRLRALKEEGWFLVGYTGNHAVTSGLESFLDAAKILSGEKVTFVLVGGGIYKEELRQYAVRIGCGNALFLDPVPRDAMAGVLGTLDACYMGLKKSPLFRYGVSPNKLYDYLLAAKPVVYAVEAPGNIVCEAGCGVSVPAGDGAAVADAVLALRDAGEEARREMGRRGRAYVLEHHEYGMLAGRYLKALEDGCRV